MILAPMTHMKVSDISINWDYNGKLSTVNIFITVSDPILTLRRFMRSMQVQRTKKYLLPMTHKPICTHQFKVINQYMYLI